LKILKAGTAAYTQAHLPPLPPPAALFSLEKSSAAETSYFQLHVHWEPLQNGRGEEENRGWSVKGKSIACCLIISRFLSSLAAIRLGTSLPFAGSQLGLESQANWEASSEVYKPPSSPGVSSVQGSVDPSRCPVPMALWSGAVGRVRRQQKVRGWGKRCPDGHQSSLPDRIHYEDL